MSTSSPIPTCPVCAGPAAEPFLRIPDVPVHCNVLWSSAEDAVSAPRGDLDLVFCRTCGHVYNVAFDPARTTYGASYENSLHHSPAFQAYARELVDSLVARYDLHDRDVVEIGAGQGDFLAMLCAAGNNRGTGFDPSYVGMAPPQPGITLVPEFYDARFADHPVDVVVCRHVLEHIERSGDFLAMVRRVIGDRPDVLAVFEVPNAEWTFRDGGIWDLIYEHCGYFSPASLRYVFTSRGFRVERVADVFGGQFLVIEARPATAGAAAADRDGAAVDALAAGVETFARTYAEKIAEWDARLTQLRSEGRSAVIWGAGSKGVTFLNVVPSASVVDRAVDLNPRKHGMYVSGSGQPIVSPEQLVDRPPDVVVVMNPNYRDEVAGTLLQLGIDAEVLVP